MSRASLQQVAVARPVSRAEVTARLRPPAPPLTVIRSAAAPGIMPPDDAPAASLLAFDPEEDLESLVPMPRSIPLEVRAELTQALARRFEHYEELDVWLHESHPALRGRSPFEQIVGGDGEGVLRALTGADVRELRERPPEGAAAVLRLLP